LLTRAHYTEGDPFLLEKRTLFAQSRLLVARADAVASPGAYVTINMAGWPLAAMADASGAIRVFRNTCRHQQMMVLDKAVGQCEGTVRCRYHGWVYDTAGRFVSAPDQYAPDAPGSEATHLLALPHAIESGLVFARVAGTESAAANAALPTLPAFTREFTTDLACNWKVLAEHWLATRGSGAFHWDAPSCAVETIHGGVAVHQVIARSFLRTRVVTHCFGTIEVSLDADKAACDARQEAIAADDAVALVGPAAAQGFREWVVAATRVAPFDDPLAKRAS
jgi:nitrite reductase/ring-hydroxylating ferredoxin subunit